MGPLAPYSSIMQTEKLSARVTPSEAAVLRRIQRKHGYETLSQWFRKVLRDEIVKHRLETGARLIASLEVKK